MTNYSYYIRPSTSYQDFLVRRHRQKTLATFVLFIVGIPSISGVVFLTIDFVIRHYTGY